MEGGTREGDADASRLRQQRLALCRFGEHALRAEDLDGLLHEACETVSEGMGIGLVKILELLPDEGAMLIRAGVGWKDGVVGHVKFGAHEFSPSGYALQTAEPVISRDVENEQRFAIPAVLREHGVRSMINVGIAGDAGGWGVLEVDSPEGRQFCEDDIVFLQNYANFLSAAIRRLKTHNELQAALENNRVLLRELQHRIRNMLANVRALAAVSTRTSTNLDEFSAAFDGRLSALIRTQEFLSQEPSSSSGIRDVLQQELDAHGIQSDGKAALKGDDIMLPADTAQALAMAFHELATNATKYGAIRNEHGAIEVSWRIDKGPESGRFVVRWRETGGDGNGPPKRQGLGLRLLERELPRRLGGNSSTVFYNEGLEYTLWFPFPGDATVD